MEKKPIIKLRVYRGREVNYDAKGIIKNDNHLVSLEYGSRNWVLFMKNLPLNGYCQVDVEKVLHEQADRTYTEGNVNLFKDEVFSAFYIKTNKPQTAEQKEIAELKSQMAILLGKKVDKKEKEETFIITESISELRDAYKEKFGKNPFNGWKEDKLLEKLAE